MLSINILKAFIAGSSILISIPFFIGFKSFRNDLRYVSRDNFLNIYFMYSITCPLYFGIVSVIAYLISYYGKIDLYLTFLIVSIIAYIITALVNNYFRIYNFSRERWFNYNLFLFIYYFIAFNVVIVNILKILLR